jgi:hypothetical protein
MVYGDRPVYGEAMHTTLAIARGFLSPEDSPTFKVAY